MSPAMDMTIKTIVHRRLSRSHVMNHPSKVAMTEATLIVEGEVKKRWPRGSPGTSTSFRSIGHEVDRRTPPRWGKVTTSSGYGAAVEPVARLAARHPYGQSPRGSGGPGCPPRLRTRLRARSASAAPRGCSRSATVAARPVARSGKCSAARSGRTSAGGESERPVAVADDIGTIREAIKTQLAAQMTDEPTIYARASSSMNPPCILIQPRSARGNSMGRAKKLEYMFSIFILLTKGLDDANWEDKIDDFLSPSGDLSIEAALRADTTLSGAIEMLDVEGWDSYGDEIVINGIGYAGARFAVRIWGREPS